MKYCYIVQVSEGRVLFSFIFDTLPYLFFLKDHSDSLLHLGYDDDQCRFKFGIFLMAVEVNGCVILGISHLRH